VGFRWCAYEQFVELGLKGKAENGKDGSVEVTVTGEESVLSKLVEWCHVGPKGAAVNRVEVTETSLEPMESPKPAQNEKHEKADT